MNRRALAFLMITWLAFVTLILFQGPQPPPAQPQPAPTDAADTANLGDKNEKSELAQHPPDQPASNLSEESEGELGKKSSLDPQAENAPKKLETVRDLLLPTIGSVDPQSRARYLITVNPIGGALRRVELNFRQAGKTTFKYRDLEDTSGYLGCLDCLDTLKGCLVRAVGHGTPAFHATANGVTGGIRAGDLLLAFNGEPLVSSTDFERLMAVSKSGETLELTINRPASLDIAPEELGVGETIKFNVELVRKPIELLRPENNEHLPSAEFPESFLLSLLKPMSVQDLVWPELDKETTSSAWIVNPVSDSEIELRYSLQPDRLPALGFEPMTLVKRFRLPKFAESDQHQLNSKSFHFELDVEVINESDKAQSVTYELDGPTGSTIETWWYAQKIHGRSTAIGYAAGARDVIGSTRNDTFIFWGCPEIAAGAAAARKYPQYICSPHVDAPEARQLNFVGVDTQYFNVSLIPRVDAATPFEVNSVTAFPNAGIVSKQTKYHRLTDCTFQLFKTIEIAAGSSYQQTFEIFAGPKDPDLLPYYGLDDARTFGWFAWLSKPLLWILHFFYWITGSFSYGIAIVMLTILVRSFMIPISHKAAINAQMMQMLQPQMQEIREKYKENPEKQGLATRDLFRRYRYNPLSGCFLGLLQLPIFLGLYRGLSVDIALRDKPLIPGMSWCNNLSGPDQLLNWASWMPAFLSDKLGFFGPYLNVLPLITVALFLVQQKMFMPPPTDDQQRLMQKMMTFMMIFMGFLFFKVAAGLCVYFITSSIWGILERKLLPKPTLDPEKFAMAEPPSPGGGNGGGVGRIGDGGGGGKSGGGGLIARIKAMQEKSQSTVQSRETDLAARKQKNADRKKRLKNREP